MLSIEIDYEVADRLVVTILEEAYHDLQESYERRKFGDDELGVFHSNLKKDLKDIEKYMKSFQRVLKYFKV